MNLQEKKLKSFGGRGGGMIGVILHGLLVVLIILCIIQYLKNKYE